MISQYGAGFGYGRNLEASNDLPCNGIRVLVVYRPNPHPLDHTSKLLYNNNNILPVQSSRLSTLIEVYTFTKPSSSLPLHHTRGN